MGGWIGFGIAKHAPERFYSVIIGGAQAYSQTWKNSWLQLFKKGSEATLATVEKVFGRRMTPELKAQVLTNDYKALIALTSKREQLSLEDVLPTITMPCMLFVGEADGHYSGARECNKLIPNATFVSLPGLNHIECIYRIDLVLPHLTKFLAEVSQKL